MEVTGGVSSASNDRSYGTMEEQRRGFQQSNQDLEFNNQLQKERNQKLSESCKNTPDRSWLYTLCTRWRGEEPAPSWEPFFWELFCPYPFCPTYQYVARSLTLWLLGMLTWGLVYSIAGSVAGPGGQLFLLARLVVCAHLGGFLFRLVSLPGLVGQLTVGIIFQHFGLADIEPPYTNVCTILRKIALVIILTRAGLDLDPEALKRMFCATLKIGLVPWLVEAAVVVAFCHCIINIPWMWCLLTASIVAAVSPAVIVPGMLQLRAKGYGISKGIPTGVIAISGIDDAASVAAFGILNSIIFSQNSLWYNMLMGPASVAVGIGFGVFWGYLSKYVPEKGDPFVVTMRVLMLLVLGLVAVFGSELVNLGGAGPLAVVAVAFVSAWLWSMQGWDIKDNPVTSTFEIFWMILEPILFSLTGTQVRLTGIGYEELAVVVTGLVSAILLRMFATVAVAYGTNFNTKEKWFIALACMAKASVQAALAPVPLDTVNKLFPDTDVPERTYAQALLLICVLSIVVTAPTGALIIAFAGPRLLTCTEPRPPVPVGKRPSLHLAELPEDDVEAIFTETN